MSMNSFAAGFFTAWFILSLVIFFTEEFTGGKYFESNSDLFLIAVTFPVSAPVILACLIARFVLKSMRRLRRRIHMGKRWRV